MNNQEYEQRKQECWEEFVGSDGFPTETMLQCFNYAFDRAYSLGKHDLSNSKGEELLTVPRKKVQRIYAGFKEREAECDTDNCGLSVSDLANVRAFDMFILFGDKCLR